jgi:hypothetical protein
LTGDYVVLKKKFLSLREEIKSALIYLKNNKAAGADSIATELLKNGGPQLVIALEEVIQLAWPSELKARSRGYCIQCTKNEINSIAQTIKVSAC